MNDEGQRVNGLRIFCDKERRKRKEEENLSFFLFHSLESRSISVGVNSISAEFGKRRGLSGFVFYVLILRRKVRKWIYGKVKPSTNTHEYTNICAANSHIRGFYSWTVSCNRANLRCNTNCT
jgi:hypothetical protein